MASSFRSFELLLDLARPLPDRDESRLLFELELFDLDLELFNDDLLPDFDEFLYVDEDVVDAVRLFDSLLASFDCESLELLAFITDLSLNSFGGYRATRPRWIALLLLLFGKLPAIRCAGPLKLASVAVCCCPDCCAALPCGNCVDEFCV